MFVVLVSGQGGAVGEVVAGMSEPDRFADPGRRLVTVHRCHRVEVDDRFDGDVRMAEPVAGLVQDDRPDPFDPPDGGTGVGVAAKDGVDLGPGQVVMVA